jgi:hypothetical protein
MKVDRLRCPFGASNLAPPMALECTQQRWNIR